MHLTPFPYVCAIHIIGSAKVSPDANMIFPQSIFSLYYLSKEIVPRLYVISYLMDTRSLLTFNRSAIITIIADCTKGTKPVSIRKLLSHSASTTASKAAMDPVSMVELAMPTCLTLLQQMAPPQRVNTYPEIDYFNFIFDWN